MKKKYLMLIVLVMVNVLLIGFVATYDIAYNAGSISGVNYTMTMIQGLLTNSSIAYHCTNLGNGIYNITIYGTDSQIRQSMNLTRQISVDCTVKQYYKGELISSEHHVGTLTTQGANWAAQQMSDSTHASSSETCVYISQTNNSAGISSASTILPNEIVNDGLQRQSGTYTLTGTGTWTVTYTFTCIGTANDPSCWGFSWGTAASTSGLAGGAITAGNNLIWYDSSAGTQTLNVGSTIAVTGTMSIS